MMRHFVIVGGGTAGHRAAIALRHGAPDACITIIGDEPGLPYDRTTLSKSVLGRGAAVASGLADLAHYGRDVTHCPATRVSALDPRAHAVETDDGVSVPYDRLLIATGSRPRALGFAVPDDVHPLHLRTLGDAVAIERQLVPGCRIAIVGGGFIGLEVAAAARVRGCSVTVLEAADRLLARGIPAVVADWVRALHEDEGVEIRCGATLEGLRRTPDGVELSGTGWRLTADLVVVGIGVVPNVELAQAAGLAVENGLVVDERCRTSLPDIYGAGEVTCHPAWNGGRHRIESWKHAGEQGAAAARAMLDEDVKFDEIPWLWSDQFDANLQSLGAPHLATHSELLGDAGSRSWTWVGLDDADHVVSAVAVNRGRDISMLRRLMRGRLGFASVHAGHKVPA